MAEREGFEPSVVFSYARFPGVCLKPLSHLSATREPNVKYGPGPRNGFLNGCENARGLITPQRQCRGRKEDEPFKRE